MKKKDTEKKSKIKVKKEPKKTPDNILPIVTELPQRTGRFSMQEPYASKYDTYIKPRLAEITAWKRDGLNDTEISKRLGMSLTSFCLYKHRYPELRQAVHDGKVTADYKIENSLFKRATGYKYDETTQELITNPKTGKSELKVTKVVTKEVAPDVAAQLFYLTNRMPEKWMDKRQVNHSGSLNLTAYQDMSDEEIQRRLDAKKQQLLIEAKQDSNESGDNGDNEQK